MLINPMYQKTQNVNINVYLVTVYTYKQKIWKLSK